MKTTIKVNKVAREAAVRDPERVHTEMEAGGEQENQSFRDQKQELITNNSLACAKLLISGNPLVSSMLCIHSISAHRTVL